MLETLRRDAARYGPYGGPLRSLGFWVGATYRFGAWASALPLPLRLPLLVLYWLLKAPCRVFLNVEIPPSARIGGGLLLAHPYNVVIGPGAELGDDCQVFHEVTVGMGPVPGLPRIGNGVVLFVGARVLGGIEIGDRAEIGANCVVTRNIPASSIVLPTPSRVIPQALVRAAADPGARESSGG